MANVGGFHAADMPARQGVESWIGVQQNEGEGEREREDGGGEPVEKSEWTIN